MEIYTQGPTGLEKINTPELIAKLRALYHREDATETENLEVESLRTELQRRGIPVSRRFIG